MSKLIFLCSCFSVFWITVLCKKMDDPVSVTCVMCLCHASSGCNFNESCTDVCGPFRITKSYWVNGGMPTVNRIPADHPGAYSDCANSHFCIFHLIQNYMKKFQRDCNGDGIIDCLDFMKIHKLGPDNCEKDVPESYQDRYDYCQDNIDI